MRRPQVGGVTVLQIGLDHYPEGPIEAECVDADGPDSPAGEPFERVDPDAGVLRVVVLGAEEAIAARVEQHDRPGADLAGQGCGGALYVGAPDGRPRRDTAHVEHDAGPMTPRERDLVDGARRLPLAGGAVVIGRV